MKKTKYALLIMMGFAMMISNSCKKDKHEEKKIQGSIKGYVKKDADADIVMKPNAIWVQDDINDNLVSIDEENQVLIMNNHEKLEMIQIGDILFSGPTKEYKDGYAFKITGKKEAGGKIEYTYEQAYLDEIFDKLEEKVEIVPNLTKENIKVYDPVPRLGGGRIGGHQRAMNEEWILDLIGISSERFKDFKSDYDDKQKLTTLTLKYIIWDADKDFKKTPEDQIVCELKFKIQNFGGNLIAGGGVFDVGGIAILGISAEFEYDFKYEKDTTAWINKLKQELLNKQLKLVSLPFAVTGSSNVTYTLSLDVFMELKIEAEAKLKATFAYEDLRMEYRVRYDNGKLTQKDLNKLKNGDVNVNLEASAKGKFSVGVGGGLFLKFPQFKYEKDKPSYVGIRSDVNYNLTLEAVGVAEPGQGISCSKMKLTSEAFWDAGIEANLGMLKESLWELELGDLIHKELRGPWSKEFDLCGDTEVLSPPVNPYPSNLQLENVQSVKLTWDVTASEEESKFYNYNVYVGTAALQKINTNELTKKEYTLSDLLPNTRYFWQVEILDKKRNRSTKGDVWVFDVGNAGSNSEQLPTISTTTIGNITATTASAGGNITNDGGTPITARGVCWSTNQNPTISNSKTSNGTGIGSYTSSITGLQPNTTYYVRAYATNSKGTAYGTQVNFKTQNTTTNPEDPYTGDNPYLNPNLTYGSMTDIDGNIYPTIQIGDQTWMAENLRTTKYNDGTPIPHITDNTQWKNDQKGAYSIYENSTAYEAIYGKLYNWYAVNTGKLCPKGWHIPTDAEWTQLETYLGSNAGLKVKSIGNSTDGTGLWRKYTNTEGTNTSGFSGLPGGFRGFNGTFGYIGELGYWWSSTESLTGYAWSRNLGYRGSSVGRDGNGKEVGFSCRCARD